MKNPNHLPRGLLGLTIFMWGAVSMTAVVTSIRFFAHLKEDEDVLRRAVNDARVGGLIMPPKAVAPVPSGKNIKPEGPVFTISFSLGRCG
jgi:hypothetical protein